MKKFFAILLVSIAAFCLDAPTGRFYCYAATYSRPLERLVSSVALKGSSFDTSADVDATSGTTVSSSYTVLMGFSLSAPSAQGSTTPTVTADSVPPVISDLLFDGVSIEAGDYVNSDAVITATVADAGGSVDTAQSSISLDGSSASFSTLSADSSFCTADGKLTYKLTGVSDGDHTIIISSYDTAGNQTSTSISFKTSAAAVSIDGVALNYPNPFNPAVQSTQIGYSLSKDAIVDIYLFNVLGQRIWQRAYAAGAEGGRAGYNKVSWDGTSDFGVMVSNDVYLCRIISEGKVIGKCKIAVLR